MAQALRIVAIGDSTTAGTPGWKSPLEAPPDGAGDATSQYAYWLMKGHPEWTVLNRGVNGERSDEIRGRFERDVILAEPSVVVVLAGVNDVYQGLPAEHVTAELRAMCDRASEAGIRVIAATIVPYNTATPDQNARMRQVNDWIRQQAAADPGIAIADTRAAVAASNDSDRLCESPDGLHPSPEGYRRMAVAVQRVLEAELRKPSARF